MSMPARTLLLQRIGYGRVALGCAVLFFTPAVVLAACTPTYSCSTTNITSTCEQEIKSTWSSVNTAIAQDALENGGVVVGNYPGTVHNDAVTRARVCSIIAPGSTPTWWRVGHYASPGDNYIFTWTGSTWVVQGATGRNDRIDGIRCASVTTNGAAIAAPAYCSPGTSSITTPTRSISVSPTSINSGGSATLSYSTTNIGAPAITTYTTAGTYSYTVPSNYTSIVVEAWGAGGGGGGKTGVGSVGGNSTFNGSAVVARGGSGGATGTTNSTLTANEGLTLTDGGTGGTATGGDFNLSGNAGSSHMYDTRYALFYGSGAGGYGAAGGAGAAYVSTSNGVGTAGTAPGGGGSGGYGVVSTSGYCGKDPCTITTYYPGSGGGGGAYARKTYAAGSLTSGSTITVVVGAGGTGGTGTPVGGAGAPGRVKITAIGGYVYISNVGYVPVNTSGSFSVSPTTNTTYTLTATQADATTLVSSAALTVNSTPSCSLSASPTSITRGNASTLSWSSANATGMSINQGIGSVALSGSRSVSPTVTTTYTGTATGSGSATCSATVDVSCTPGYTCSGDTIQYQNAACAISNISTCSSPGYCSPGSSICLYPPMTPTPIVTTDGATLSGHLVARPSLVRSGTSTKLYWNIENAQVCVVRRLDTNAVVSTQTSSGSSGVAATITAKTDFRLYCEAYPNTSPANLTDIVTARVVPSWLEAR